MSVHLVGAPVSDVEVAIVPGSDLGDEFDAALSIAVKALNCSASETVARKDGLLSATFATLSVAENAAIAIQLNLRSRPRSGLVGLYFGLVESTYYHDPQRVAALLARSGHPGQILIGIPDGRIPETTSGRRLLGIHKLAPDTGRLAVFQTENALLSSAFPPLRSMRVADNNLRCRTKAFFGREDELLELSIALTANRWVHLFGPAGIGKTALAWRLGIACSEDLYRSVWFANVEGALTEDSALSQIAEALAIFARKESDARNIVLSQLAGPACLLMLDGIEESVQADFCANLLHSCPSLTLVSMGRHAVPGHPALSFEVNPLAVPHDEVESWDEFLDYASGRLLLDRLHRSGSGAPVVSLWRSISAGQASVTRGRSNWFRSKPSPPISKIGADSVLIQTIRWISLAR